MFFTERLRYVAFEERETIHNISIKIGDTTLAKSLLQRSWRKRNESQISELHYKGNHLMSYSVYTTHTFSLTHRFIVSE